MRRGTLSYPFRVTKGNRPWLETGGSVELLLKKNKCISEAFVLENFIDYESLSTWVNYRSIEMKSYAVDGKGMTLSADEFCYRKDIRYLLVKPVASSKQDSSG